ncbi:MAG TPA: tRNA-intron lyase [Nitrososphaera sp.]
MASSPSTTSPISDNSSTAESAADVETIEGYLARNGKIVIVEPRFQDGLRAKGFGEKEDHEYVLKPYEALYLLNNKRLTFKNKPGISFSALFEIVLRHDKNIMSDFVVYRDLRSRGYVAKEGFGFGNDFRVYERGKYDKKPAKYVVFGIKEGTNTTAKEFAVAVQQIQRMGKEAVVAVIERRGEVIYYKASKIRLSENRYQTKNNT